MKSQTTDLLSSRKATLRCRGALLLLLASAALWDASVALGDAPAPELTHTDAAAWINSPPLSLTGLRGRPVLVEFWTFECVNCRRTLPWLKAMQKRYAPEGLEIIAVHSPEFPEERDPENVREAVASLDITYPVMLDADFSYWKAMHNQYWPAFYLVDSSGSIVAAAVGELHEGHARADSFEHEISRVLAESGL